MTLFKVPQEKGLTGKKDCAHPLVLNNRAPIRQAPSWVCIWIEVCKGKRGSAIQWKWVGKYQPYPVRPYHAFKFMLYLLAGLRLLGGIKICINITWEELSPRVSRKFCTWWGPRKWHHCCKITATRQYLSASLFYYLHSHHVSSRAPIGCNIFLLTQGAMKLTWVTFINIFVNRSTCWNGFVEIQNRWVTFIVPPRWTCYCFWEINADKLFWYLG